MDCCNGLVQDSSTTNTPGASKNRVTTYWMKQKENVYNKNTDNLNLIAGNNTCCCFSKDKSSSSSGAFNRRPASQSISKFRQITSIAEFIYKRTRKPCIKNLVTIWIVWQISRLRFYPKWRSFLWLRDLDVHIVFENALPLIFSFPQHTQNLLTGHYLDCNWCKNALS